MNDLEKQVFGLSILIQIAKRVREAAKPEEIGFLAVNETKQLVDYRQAALWLSRKGVFSVSGLPLPEQRAPYTQWLTAASKSLRAIDECRRIHPSDLPQYLSDSWQDWLPEYLVVCPLLDAGKTPVGLLLLARDKEWEDHELSLLTEICAIYAHGFMAHARRSGFGSLHVRTLLRRPATLLVIIGFILGLLFVPVRLSVQAPAEVSPKDPLVIRSPLDAVIEGFRIRPNENVQEGQILFVFDKTNIKSKFDVASKAYNVSREEYRQTAQMAVSDEKSRPELEPRRGRMHERATELSYLRYLYDRVEVKTPRSGVAIFADANDWIGKSVSIGEKVLVIADPSRIEILIHLPIADAIELGPGTDVTLYLVADPQKPRHGKVTYASYKPEVTPAGFVAYRIKADFVQDGTPLPRVGLTGIAKIYSHERVSLAYFIFRRPLTVLRQGIGW